MTRGQNTLKVGIAQRDVAKSEEMEHDRKKARVTFSVIYDRALIPRKKLFLGFGKKRIRYMWNNLLVGLHRDAPRNKFNDYLACAGICSLKHGLVGYQAPLNWFFPACRCPGSWDLA